jgi:hypothetical protein
VGTPGAPHDDYVDALVCGRDLYLTGISRRRFARSGCVAPNGVSIEVVIWDFGGALTPSPFEAFHRYEAQRGLPWDLIRTVNATNFE